MALDILIIDDEQDIRDLVAGLLEDEGYAARTAADADAALAAIAERRPGLVLLDVWLKDSRLDGLELLQVIKERDPGQPVIVMSGHGSLDTAVSAVRRGAIDFLEKPFATDKLLLMVDRATEFDRLRRENAELKSLKMVDDELRGVSGAINNVRATLKRVANTGSRVLITGPAGVGKEVAAKLLHKWSARADAPFVIVAAARMEPARVEEELFGLEQNGELVRPGLIELAQGGTLFLDEIADMPLPTQGKILRVLTDQHFTRIGGSRPVKVDMRVVSATARDLREEIEAGRFREDLFYRLNVVPLHIPPLAERREDILPLASHFAEHYARDRGIPTPDFAPEAVVALQTYGWQGNVRQLRNVIERTFILAPTSRLSVISADLLPPEVVGAGEGGGGMLSASAMAAPLKEARESFEREYLRVQIERFAGNVSKTAAFIGMERSALHRKLKLLGLTDKSDG